MSKHESEPSWTLAGLGIAKKTGLASFIGAKPPCRAGYRKTEPVWESGYGSFGRAGRKPSFDLSTTSCDVPIYFLDLLDTRNVAMMIFITHMDHF
jgi:hypothetical protein